MLTGVVKWFNPDKGYGFITPDKGGADAFVHSSQVRDSGLSGLSEGERVEYELTSNKGRACAANLKIVH